MRPSESRECRPSRRAAAVWVLLKRGLGHGLAEARGDSPMSREYATRSSMASFCPSARGTQPSGSFPTELGTVSSGLIKESRQGCGPSTGRSTWRCTFYCPHWNGGSAEPGSNSERPGAGVTGCATLAYGAVRAQLVVICMRVHGRVCRARFITATRLAGALGM